MDQSTLSRAGPIPNRKLFYSINIQMISDANYHLLNVVQGEHTNSFVLQNSSVGRGLAQGASGDGLLIGK